MNIQKSYRQEETAGTLYLVATPIGNLEDMTFRAVRTLQEADLIAAEDTRQTRKLLTHYQVSTRMVSYHEHNKESSGRELLAMLEEGKRIALVSDAGMPAISDPGYELVRQAAERGIAVVPIPGANAALSALVASGLATDRFLFAGFPPRDKKGFREVLEELRTVQATMIFYESPHRVAKTLTRMLEVWGDRQIVLAREITKRYEEIVRAPISECLTYLEEHPPLGEYCIVADRDRDAAAPEDGAWWAELSPEEHVGHYLNRGEDRKSAIKKTATDREVPKRDIYNQLL